ncbi:hypothetical protein GFL49_15490 [Rhizobium leguminosarum bv. viciae]|nr:hypothetical protein [Rhizobium leguminosarum bv. viciae]
MVRDHDPGRGFNGWGMAPHLGLTLAGVGLLGFGYMQFHVVEPISIKLWLIPITILAAGVAIL